MSVMCVYMRVLNDDGVEDVCERDVCIHACVE